MGVALLLTLGTFIAGKVVGDPEMTIAFGILHSIALSLILIGLLEKIIPFKWSWIYLAIGVVMFTAGSLLEEIQTFFLKIILDLWAFDSKALISFSIFSKSQR